MPLPMVHLAIAVQMCELNNKGLTPSFLLGSIAPDAIHMRPNTGRSHKDQTHLLDSSDVDYAERVHALLAQHGATDSEASDLAKGYVAHLLADRMWVQTVIIPSRARIPSGLSPQEKRTLYYQDADQIDLDVYHQAPWRPYVWEQLAMSQPIDFYLLTAQEIGQWRDRTLKWYEQQKSGPRETVFITYADTQDFVSQAAQVIAAYFAVWKTAIGKNPG
jgi:hypothetical protein